MLSRKSPLPDFQKQRTYGLKKITFLFFIAFFSGYGTKLFCQSSPAQQETLVETQFKEETPVSEKKPEKKASPNLSFINFYSPDYKISFQNGLTLESGTDAMPQHLGPDFYTVWNQKEILVTTGMRFFQESFDFTQEAVYWPTLFNKHQLGPGSIFHFYMMFGIFKEIDFLPGLFYRYDNQKRFKFTGSVLYFRKDAFIDIGKESVLHIGNNNLGAKLAFEFTPVNKFKINVDFSSYSFYRYMLFFAPDLNLKFSLNLSKNFTTGLEFDVQYVDLFTLSANFNCISFRTFVNMEI